MHFAYVEWVNFHFNKSMICICKHYIYRIHIHVKLIKNYRIIFLKDGKCHVINAFLLLKYLFERCPVSFLKNNRTFFFSRTMA